MNWLLNNPIAEMPGPQFLGLYAIAIVLVCVEAKWRSRRADRSEDLGPAPIPTKPDPEEIAYLRGGENELARLVVFDLIGRGYLRVDEEPKKLGKGTVSRIMREATPPDPDHLSPIEADAYDYFRIPRKPEALFQAGGLGSRIKALVAPLDESLREQQLLSPGERYGAAWRNWFAGATMILAIGGYKLAVALSRGRHNFGFLIGFALLGLIVLGCLCAVPRLTRRGKAYLVRLRETFEGLGTRLNLDPATARYDPALALVPAVFGVAILAGTPYDHVPALFRKSAATSGSCGGGCGAASGGGDGGGGCGGGGCGGGCGGCGG